MKCFVNYNDFRTADYVNINRKLSNVNWSNSILLTMGEKLKNAQNHRKIDAQG